MGASDEPPGAERLLRYEAAAMASPLRLAIHGPDRAGADSAWRALRDEFEACEEAMSRFRESSGITRLNRVSASGSPLTVDRRLRHALVLTDRARRATGGRFDPRRVLDLDRLGYRGVPVATSGGHPPTEEPGGRRAEDREAAGQRAGGDASGREGREDRDDRIVEIGRDGCARVAEPVDLGGIGKGLALRWAADQLRAFLPEGGGALVEAGGDVTAVGPAPDGEAWLVGIGDPWGGADPLAVVALLDAAVATSSIAVNRWRSPAGEVVHHLIDPVTGAPGGEGLVAVTVHGPDPGWNEVRTKQLFLAGAGGIGALARSLGLAAWWIADDGSVTMTPGARLLTAWTAPIG